MIWFFAAVIVLLALVVLLVVAKKQRQKRKPIPVPAGVEDLQGRVRAAFSHLRSFGRRTRAFGMLALWNKSSKASFHPTRHILVIGPPASGKTGLLSQLSSGVRYAKTYEPPETLPCNVFNLKGALAIELAGRVLADEDANGRGGDAYMAGLEELRRRSPDRPLDSIVLTLSCEAQLSKLAQDDAADWPHILRKRIDELRLRLKTHVPVYLVVTHCEAISSFAGFCTSVAEQGEQILGWTNPNEDPVEAPPDWVEETFACLNDELTRSQMHRYFAAVPSEATLDSFVFPERLADVAEPLRSFVDTIFRDRPDEAPALRGIYFVGSRADGAGPPNTSLAPPESSKPAFNSLPSAVPAASLAPALEANALPLQDPQSPSGGQSEYGTMCFATALFADFILKEGHLAEPIQSAMQQRRREVRFTQVAAALVCILGFVVYTLESYTLGADTENLAAPLKQVSTELDELRLLRQTQAINQDLATTFEASRRLTADLLDQYAKVTTKRLARYSVPLSFLFRLDARVDDAFTEGYTQIAFPAFRQAIQRQSALSIPPPNRAQIFAIDAPIETTSEYQYVETLLSETVSIQRSLNDFNDLLQSNNSQLIKQLDRIAALSNALLNHPLPPTFQTNAAHYSRGLLRSHNDLRLTQVFIDAASDTARRRTLLGFEWLHERIVALSGGSVPAAISELREALSVLETRNAASYAASDLRKLGHALHVLDTQLGRASLSWVAADRIPAPDEKYQRLISQIDNARLLLGPEFRGAILSKREEDLGRFQQPLKDERLPLVGALLDQAEGGALSMRLSPGLLALKEPTTLLLSQDYLKEENDAPQPLSIQPPRVSWDPEPLKVAGRMLKEFESTLQNGPLTKFPIQAQPKLRSLAQRSAAARTLSLVAQAVHSEPATDGAQTPEHVMKTDSDNLGTVAPPLREILAGLKLAQLSEAEDAVRQLVTAQGERILKTVQQVLGSAALYSANFSAWEGAGPPAYPAFYVADAAQLGDYVVRQRGYAEKVAHGFVEPVLALMRSPEVSTGAHNEVVAFWSGVLSALHDYESKKPGSSLIELERFLLSDLVSIDSYNKCMRLLSKTSAWDKNGDFFSNRRSDLKKSLYQRCASESRSDREDRYEALYGTFKRELQNRFPFTRNPQAEDAIPESVRSFLQEASAYSADFRELLLEERTPQSLAQVQFLDQLETVRAFLVPLWSQDDSTDGFIDVRAKFRANPEQEVGGNEIVEWNLRFGETPLSLGGKRATARWHVDDGVKAQFRWAKHAPTVPKSTPGVPSTVDQQTITETYTGSWALLRLISAHLARSADLGVKGEKVSLLRFRVRTAPNPDGGFLDRVGADSAQIFIALTLSGGDKGKVLSYPIFPTLSPEPERSFETQDSSKYYGRSHLSRR